MVNGVSTPFLKRQIVLTLRFMMKVPKGPIPDCSSTEEPDPALKVFVAYEASEDGLHALRLYQGIIRKFDKEYRFDVDFRRFEVLDVPFLRTRAAMEAIEADLLIIAVDGRFPLTAEFQSWIDEWVEKKVGWDSALVLLTRHSRDRDNDGSASVREYLRNVALRGEMTFIVGATEGAAAIKSPSLDQFPTETRLIIPHDAEHLENRLAASTN